MKKKESISLFEAISRGRGHRPHPEMAIPDWIRKKADAANKSNEAEDQPVSDSANQTSDFKFPEDSSHPSAGETPTKPSVLDQAETTPDTPTPPTGEAVSDELAKKDVSTEAEQPKESTVAKLFGKLSTSVSNLSKSSVSVLRRGGKTSTSQDDGSAGIPTVSGDSASATIGQDTQNDNSGKRKGKTKSKKEEPVVQGGLLSGVDTVASLPQEQARTASADDTKLHAKKDVESSSPGTALPMSDATKGQPPQADQKKSLSQPLPYRSPGKPANMYPNADELKIPESLTVPDQPVFTPPELPVSQTPTGGESLSGGRYGKAAIKVNSLNEPIFSFSGGLMKISVGMRGCIIAVTTIIVISLGFFFLGWICSPSSPDEPAATTQEAKTNGNGGTENNAPEAKFKAIVGKYYIIVCRFNGVTPADVDSANQVVDFLKTKGVPAYAGELVSRDTDSKIKAVICTIPFDSDQSEYARGYLAKVIALGHEYYRATRLYDFSEADFQLHDPKSNAGGSQ